MYAKCEGGGRGRDEGERGEFRRSCPWSQEEVSGQAVRREEVCKV